MNRPWVRIYVAKPTDARGWIGLGCFVLALLVLGMIKFERELLNSDAFLILATAIIITGWVQGPVSWAYAATKGGGELADKNADIVKHHADARPTGAPDDPLAVVGPESKSQAPPVQTETKNEEPDPRP